jgi:hypothetical protein
VIEPTQDAGAAAGKVACVRVRLKADEVGLQNTLGDGASLRQHPKDFRRRERSVQKEGNRHIRLLCTQQRRQQHQMVVVDPDDITVTVRRQHHLCKRRIGLVRKDDLSEEE